MTKLSLCMIVKNEEKFLEQCLNSVRELVDEIVIVDTGSTDKTKEIAAKFTNKIFDFSAERNESLKHATGDWILVLDADETIAWKDLSEIRKLIDDADASVGGFVLLQRNYVSSLDNTELGFDGGLKVRGVNESERGLELSKGDGYEESKNSLGWLSTPIVRLFRNSLGTSGTLSVAFSGKVHEDVSPSLKTSIVNSNIPIHHFGKLDLAHLKEKWEMYERIGKQKAELEKDYFSYYELGRQYLERGKIEEAKEMFLQSLKLNAQFWVSWLNLGSIQLLQKELDSAIESLEKARQLNPRAVAIYNNMGVTYAQKKEFQKALDSFVLSLNINPKQADVFRNMGRCYREMGDKMREGMAFQKAKELGG